ncbi:MAG: NAD(P)/FAD-dependent oxidoreductase, partial [Gemmatimonadaceae bacterium]
CVDNEVLLAALRTALGRHRMVRLVKDHVIAVALQGGSMPSVTAASGETYGGRRIVLAAGAWVTEIRGLPSRLPVEPVRGQMIAFDAPPSPPPPPLVTYGPQGYLVPRGKSRTLAGSTMERVGLRAGTTDEGVSALRSAATAISPALADAPIAARWSGFRPITPDLLPILGADPAHPELLYACGHGRNGILLAPLTGDCIAALVEGSPPPASLEPFNPRRFLDR